MNGKMVWPSAIIALVLLTGCVARQGAAPTSGAQSTSETPQSDVGARTGGAKGPSPAPAPTDTQR